jgi:hypothetical protein
MVRAAERASGEPGMATQARTRTQDLYEEDFYVWTEAQAALLRERRFEAIRAAAGPSRSSGIARGSRSS